MLNTSNLLRNSIAARRVTNPNQWMAGLSRSLVQETWCTTGNNLCNQEIAGKIVRGVNLSLFSQQELGTMISAFDKYPSSSPSSLGYLAKRILINHQDLASTADQQPFKSNTASNSGEKSLDSDLLPTFRPGYSWIF